MREGGVGHDGGRAQRGESGGTRYEQYRTAHALRGADGVAQPLPDTGLGDGGDVTGPGQEFPGADEKEDGGSDGLQHLRRHGE